MQLLADILQLLGTSTGTLTIATSTLLLLNTHHKFLVGIDAQCLSYLIDGMHAVSAPTDLLAKERIALTRIFFYTHGFVITPTVLAECSRIRDIARRANHESWIRVQFFCYPITNESIVDLRTSELVDIHPKVNDCKIIAEAECCGFYAVLSYDQKFLRRMSKASLKTRLMQPSDYWTSMEIRPGTNPVRKPDSSNPLANQSWWRI